MEIEGRRRRYGRGGKGEENGGRREKERVIGFVREIRVCVFFFHRIYLFVYLFVSLYVVFSIRMTRLVRRIRIK